MARMKLVVLLCCFVLPAMCQQMDNDWLDPNDMINYDSSTKTMKKRTEVRRFYMFPLDLFGTLLLPQCI